MFRKPKSRVNLRVKNLDEKNPNKIDDEDEEAIEYVNFLKMCNFLI